VFRGYGVPYTVARFDASASPRTNLTALLWKPDGSARYAGIVTYPNLEATGTLTQAEVETLWSYQRKTGARAVKFGGWSTNFGFNPDLAACGSPDQPMVFTANTPLGISGIKSTARLSSEGLYRWVACVVCSRFLCAGAFQMEPQPTQPNPT